MGRVLLMLRLLQLLLMLLLLLVSTLLPGTTNWFNLRWFLAFAATLLVMGAKR